MVPPESDGKGFAIRRFQKGLPSRPIRAARTTRLRPPAFAAERARAAVWAAIEFGNGLDIRSASIEAYGRFPPRGTADPESTSAPYVLPPQTTGATRSGRRPASSRVPGGRGQLFIPAR